MEESPKGRKKGGTIPPLPGNTFSSLLGSGRFDEQFIEERRQGLEQFLNSVANHVICRFEASLHAFLQGKLASCKRLHQSHSCYFQKNTQTDQHDSRFSSN